MKDIQNVYKDEMARNGYGPMTFPLDLNVTGDVVVQMVELDYACPAGKLNDRGWKMSIPQFNSKMIVEDSGDWKANDWGIWFNPKLER